jgi:hypothetical protein
VGHPPEPAHAGRPGRSSRIPTDARPRVSAHRSGAAGVRQVSICLSYEGYTYTSVFLAMREQ